MNAFQSLLNIWKIVGVYYVLVILTVLLAARWFGLIGAIALFSIELFLHVRWWNDLKSKLLNGLRDEYQYVPANLEEDFSPLDVESLRRSSEELESLGFIRLKDFKLSADSGGNPSDFSRLFSHPQHHCCAELLQMCPPGRALMPIGYTISSVLENGWRFASTQIKPNGISYMWRDSKDLWSYHASAMPTELLSAHLERRQQIAENLGAIIFKDFSWEVYLDLERERAVKRKENLKRKNIIIALIEATLFELKMPWEWMGEYRKIAAKKR